MNGRVILAGAGCGAYDLMTLRGFEALKQCTAVVYDALIDIRLLDFVPKDAQQICVGKRAGQHSADQEEICALLVSLAQQGHTVVRLKGGDPFVFGRGGEEILALQQNEIPYTLIPGISSCIAVPELAGIPVTHRMVSRGFHVITAHHAKGTADFSAFAGLEGTLVFLMGLQKLPEIAAGLQEGGMSGDTPAAVISDGASVHQRVVRSTLSQIANVAMHCTPPAVIVVGDTAAYDFSPTIHGALDGVSVTVTGTPAFTGRTSDLLIKEGATVSRVSHVRTVQRKGIPPLDDWDCLVLTSRNGAAYFLEHLRAHKIDLRRLAVQRFAVIGSSTASLLENAGIYADIIPEIYTTEALAQAISASLPKPSRILLLRAENGAPELPHILQSNDFVCRDEAIYATVAVPEVIPHSIKSDYLVFGSASGVRFFFEKGVSLPPQTKLVCIGTRTAQEAGRYSKNPILTAAPYTARGICQCLKEDYHAKIQKTQSN